VTEMLLYSLQSVECSKHEVQQLWKRVVSDCWKSDRWRPPAGDWCRQSV